VNIAAWERALTNAARHGRISKHDPNKITAAKTKADNRGIYSRSDHLVLRVDDNLLRELESPEWGRPVALGSVFVSDGFTFPPLFHMPF
jgi:charged multivesicular body protein 7